MAGKEDRDGELSVLERFEGSLIEPGAVLESIDNVSESLELLRLH